MNLSARHKLRCLAQGALLLCGCLHLLLGNLGILQMGAWAGMVITRAPQFGWAEAVQQTFDGQHPCRLCCVLQKAGPTEDAQPAAPASSRIQKEWLSQKFLAGPVVLLPAPAVRKSIVLAGSAWIAFPGRAADSPPVPPPKALV